MALIFQRLAQNFIKNGYFPTDGGTLDKIASMLQPSNMGRIDIFDPCCGEGTALAELKHHLSVVHEGDAICAHGIEYDKERAAHAENLLDVVIHSDINDCVIGKNQYGLLFLNPPYGDRSGNQIDGFEDGNSGRLEVWFLDQAFHSLVSGGVFVYIVPNYIVNEKLAKRLATRLSNINVFKADEDRFKQVVIMGTKSNYSNSDITTKVKSIVDKARNYSESLNVSTDTENIYIVPASKFADVNKFVLKTMHPSIDQLNQVIKSYPCLWDNPKAVFGTINTLKRRPVSTLSKWHLSLMLAAGQVSGLVKSSDGRYILVKGGTHKEKRVSTDVVATEESVTEIKTMTDIFVPLVKGIDLTLGTPSFGNILTIN